MNNFDNETLAGGNVEMQEAVDTLREKHGFDFASLGLTANFGSPLKWVYSSGKTSDRLNRISLSPGHGIGGIVLKAGRPMAFSNIDEELDPREYSSFPIVFAEDLRSFYAAPLSNGTHVVAVVICAFRYCRNGNDDAYQALIDDDLSREFCGLTPITRNPVDFSAGEHNTLEPATSIDDASNPNGQVDVPRIIEAQEFERRRISRELHDGIAQELLAVTFTLRRLDEFVSDDGKAILNEATGGINGVLEELHNISVLLRPSALDHLGFVPALRSQALLLEKTYGTSITFEGDLQVERFDSALETQAYRICQEAMTNACKYSGSDTVNVSICKHADELTMSVSDIGCGFNVDKPEIKGSGCGLLGMRERAAVIGAKLAIESNDAGTTVTLTVPLAASEDHPVQEGEQQ